MMGKYDEQYDCSIQTVTEMPVDKPLSRRKRAALTGKTKETADAIIWDSEGFDAVVNGTAVQYTGLFGNSSGAYLAAPELHTLEMLEFLCTEGRRLSDRIHLAFAFNYDVNMILRDLRRDDWETLHKTNKLKWKGYFIDYVPSKWFKVSSPKGRIEIQDIFTNFQESLVGACSKWIPDKISEDEWQVLTQGKNDRGSFVYENLDYVIRYWQVENEIVERLFYKFRETLYARDLKVTSWHGPGSVAKMSFDINDITLAMDITPDPVYDYARYAYAGGRFEIFNIGSFIGEVHTIDINSAYPKAQTTLPNLNDVKWRRNLRPHHMKLKPHSLYRITWDASKIPGLTYEVGGGLRASRVMPFHHRTKNNTMLFPVKTTGVHYTITIDACLKIYPEAIETGALVIHDGWELMRWEYHPFYYNDDLFTERRKLKALGDASEKAIKLQLNSQYGKTAQRVGWEYKQERKEWTDLSEELRNPRKLQPPFHQLEWAAETTAWCRAMIFHMASQIHPDNLIAIETDGITVTGDITHLVDWDGKPLQNSSALGEWEMEEYTSVRYVQNGVYYLEHAKGKHAIKTRGSNRGTLTGEDIIEYLKGLHARTSNSDRWPELVQVQTRFIGAGAALAKREEEEFHELHCQWRTSDRLLSLDNGSKRVHRYEDCPACLRGEGLGEAMHALVVDDAWQRSLGLTDVCCKHEIPWLDMDDATAVDVGREEEERKEHCYPIEFV